TALAANPWLREWPMALADVEPLRPRIVDSEDAIWSIRDPEGSSLPLKLRPGDGWTLAALSGGKRVTLIGEWDGEQLAPLGVAADGKYYARWGPHARLARVS